MGFVKGKDILSELPQPKESNMIEPREVVEESKPVPTKMKAPIFLNFIINFFSKIKSRLKMPHFPAFKKLIPARIPLIFSTFFVFLLVALVLIFLLWWRLPKAEVALFIRPQVSEEEYTIKLNPSLMEIDKENLALPAKNIETVLEEEKTANTTGTKLIGEKAKGKVTIYNRTSSEKTFNSGTEIIGPGGLKFNLNDKVTVASESAGSDYTRIPGKAEIEVTASTIGTESNLASGSEFAIANFSKSDYVAKNEAAFAGGVSREVQVVAKKDQEKVLAELTDELKNKALGNLSDRVVAGEKLVEESLSSKVVDKKYDKNVDEEGDELTLRLKIKFSALAYDEEEFKKLIEEKIANAVPEGYEFRGEDSEVGFSLKEVTQEGAAIFIAHFRANFYPKLDVESIRNGLVGKKPEIGEAYLQMMPGIDSFEVKIYPPLPAKLATFPRVASHIRIEVRRE